MPPTYSPATVVAGSLIPHPQLVRHRLCVVRAEARLLARLLRLAEDRVLTFPLDERDPQDTTLSLTRGRTRVGEAARE
jgi:hypothetical protein